MLRVGLTGGIACGKSLVRASLERDGFKTLDLDHLSHAMLEPGGKAHEAVLREFGRDLKRDDGTIDRKALGAIVFSDPLARERLNALIHPEVRQEESRLAARWEAEGIPLLLTDAALLVEAGVHLRFDRLVVVYCSRDEQLQRLITRDGLTEAEALARIGAQMPIEEKRAFAHYPVSTSGSKEEALKQAKALGKELQALSSEARPSRVNLAPERASGALACGPGASSGLGPLELFDRIVADRGLELQRFVPQGSLWYRVGRPSNERLEPLAVPLVLWTLARGTPDRLFLLSAAASIGRMMRGREPVADLCLWSLFLLHVAIDGGPPLAAEWLDWLALAERWGGGEASGVVLEMVSSALDRIEQKDPPTLGGDAVDAAVALALGIEAPPPALVAKVQELSTAF